MKKILYIGLLALGFASCSDFLDIDDETKISNDKLFSTLSGVEEALDGVYYEMGNGNYYGSHMIIGADVKGGNLKVNDLNFENPSSYYYIPAFEFTHTVNGDDDYFSDCYGQIYKVISAANTIIENIDYVEDATDTEKAQAVAEAKVVRALAHFDLTRLYAQPYSYTANAQHLGIPYLHKNIAYHERTTRDLLFDNYEDIIADLTDAEQNLGTAIGIEGAKYAKAYMSKVGAQALLARVYLYKGDWDKAREYATKVIENGSVSLIANSEVEDSYSSNNPTSEDIFVIDNEGRNNAAPLSDRIGVSEKRERFYLIPSNDIISLYEDGDVRKQLFTAQVGTKATRVVTRKWTEKDGKDHYIPVVRLAEMYLIRAEACLNMPVSDEVQARADLDVIRKRANPNVVNIQLSGTALKEELFLERRRELAFEGHLFYDIVRMGRDLRRVDCNATQNVNLDYPNNLYVLPIPEEAIESNGQMIQNPGY